MSKILPFVKPGANITLRVILITTALTLLLTAANTFLALKIGMLTSASIPAALLAMAILKGFKKTSVLEINLIQTGASAGEAVAGGIVYTIPAMVIVHLWGGFSYLENFLIAFTGGLLGVVFSVPLRRFLVKRDDLPFPEGRAIAELLKLSSAGKISTKPMLQGIGFGVIGEFLQNGPQIIASQFQKIWLIDKSFIHVGLGFSTTLLGAGYLMGLRLGIGLLIGAFLNYCIILPILSHLSLTAPTLAAAPDFMAHQLKYIGLGAMLMAAFFTLVSFGRLFLKSCLEAGARVFRAKAAAGFVPLTDQDLSRRCLLGLAGGLILVLFLLLQHFIGTMASLTTTNHYGLVIGIILFIIIMGFVATAICGYFSGLVGVTASPGSAIILGVVILGGALLKMALSCLSIDLLQPHYQHLALAIIIITASIITGMACIANDNLQDLKVGQLLGATPRHQQVMLMFGVVVAALVIPLLLDKLFQVYGIAGVVPRVGMDPTQTLAAPPAAMVATLATAIFGGHLPLPLLALGAALVAGLAIVKRLFSRGSQLSLLSVGMGMYFSMDTTLALFFGAALSHMVQRAQPKAAAKKAPLGPQQASIFACGLVCGAAILDVILAFPFAMTGNPDLLKITSGMPIQLPLLLAFVMLAILTLKFRAFRDDAT